MTYPAPARRGRRALALAASLLVTTGLAAVGTLGSAAAAEGPEWSGWGAWGYKPVPLAARTGTTKIAVGGAHAVALQSDGSVIAWGPDDGVKNNGDFGQVTHLPTGLRAVDVAAGTYHSLAATTDGTVAAWGADDGNPFEDYGQVRDVPAGLTHVTAVAAGADFSAALKDDGTVVAWGLNDGHAVDGVGALSHVRAIAAAGSHGLALRDDDTVVGWGSTYGGAVDVPPGLTGVTQIATGSFHSLALKDDGTVVAWGGDGIEDYGQTDVPAGLDHVVAVAAGRSHSMALRSDGSVVAWGDDQYGQATVPADLRSGASGIAAGGTWSFVRAPVPTPVTVTASSATLPFGKALPTPRFRVAGLAADDSLVRAPSCTVSGGYDVGVHAHRCSGATAPAGYSVSHVPGTVRITRASTRLSVGTIPRATTFQPRAVLARVHDGVRLRGLGVSFRSRGTTVCRATTGATGLAVCARKVRVGPTLTAVFSGTTRYTATSRVRSR